MSVLGPAGDGSGAFSAAGDRWRFVGGLSFQNAKAVLGSVSRLPLPASGSVDMGGLTHADSAALAVLLALQRRAARESRTLRFLSLPAALTTLASVYGIEALIAS